MANAIQHSVLSGTIYSEALVKQSSEERWMVKCRVGEKDRDSGEVMWHNIVYFTNSKSEVEFLTRALIRDSVISASGRFRFKRKKHEKYNDVELMSAYFACDSLSVLHVPSSTAVKPTSSDNNDFDPFADDDTHPSLPAERALPPSQPSSTQGRHAPSNNYAPTRATPAAPAPVAAHQAPSVSSPPYATRGGVLEF